MVHSGVNVHLYMNQALSNHPKEIVSKIKDNLYLAVVFSPLLVIFTTPELVIFILTLLFNIIFFQRKRSHDNIFNRD